jgi:hypothetical protein
MYNIYRQEGSIPKKYEIGFVYRAELSMVIALFSWTNIVNVKISFYMHENASEGTSKFIFSAIRAI